MEEPIVGHLNAVASSATVSSGGRTRMHFAVKHLFAAARFARRSKELEAEHAEELLGSFFDEIISYVSATILSSIASVEANINEMFVDADEYFKEQKPALMSEIWKSIEKKPTLEKYQMAFVLKTGERIPKGEKAFQDVDSLIKLRNALVHFNPEWPDEQDIHRKIEQRLCRKFDLSPFMISAPFFPDKCMSSGCAKWAVTVSLDFMSEFSKKAGVPDKFESFQTQLTLL